MRCLGVLFGIFNTGTQICPFLPPQDLRSSYYKDYVQNILRKKPNKIRYQEQYFWNKIFFHLFFSQLMSLTGVNTMETLG